MSGHLQEDLVITRPYISLIYPAYNEAATICETLHKTIDYFARRGLHYEIIVAADGNDGTRELVREMAAGNAAIQVIGGEERRGKGRGVREAVALAKGEIIGYADADYKVPIEEFERLEPFLKQGHHVVFGSRGLRQSIIERKQRAYRRIGSWGFRMFLRVVLGLWNITDTQCGFKFFQREIALHLFRVQKIDGYMFDVEILSLAELFGYRVTEVPIRWRDDADSRLKLLSGNIRNVIDVFRIRWSQLEHRKAPMAMRAGAGRDA
jgi:dolichyl-phosphate beta-glucosyltransferase